VSRMGEHANDLYTAGVVFSTTEATNAHKLNSEVVV
jgi:hypothetical protein